MNGSEGSAIAGEGWAEHGVAWSFPDQNTLAHEVGHLLGRQHVFTGSEAGPFYDHLANYGSYPYGSIGQLGVNTLTNRVYHRRASWTS